MPYHYLMDLKKKKEKEKNNLLQLLKLKEALDDELHTGFPPALFFSTQDQARLVAIFLCWSAERVTRKKASSDLWKK